MSKVVLSEGRHDLRFLRELHLDHGDHYEFDVFDNEMASITQSRRISHHEMDSSINYLFKAEGGKSKLIKIFSDLAVEFYNSRQEVILMVDLDGDAVQDFEDQVNTALWNDYQNNISYNVINSTSHPHIACISSELDLVGLGIEPIDVIGFDTSLEDVTGINDNDDGDDQIRKIRRYMSSNPAVINSISDIVY